MASEQRRQRKAKLKRKREKENRKTRNIARNFSARDYVLQLARGPWHDCYEIQESGLTQLMCVRRACDGFGACVFLLDEYCLGVKDAMVVRNISPSDFADMAMSMDGRKISSAYAAKKINDMIAWSQEIGFSPHPATHTALQIFRGVDPEECKESFAFGSPDDGRPMFVAGPHDSPDFIHKVLQQLRKLGDGASQFIFAGTEDFLAEIQQYRLLHHEAMLVAESDSQNDEDWGDSSALDEEDAFEEEDFDDDNDHDLDVQLDGDDKSKKTSRLLGWLRFGKP